jgi:hypothetical protein
MSINNGENNVRKKVCLIIAVLIVILVTITFTRAEGDLSRANIETVILAIRSNTSETQSKLEQLNFIQVKPIK